MLRLQNESDPKIIQPKHLKGKKILYRWGDKIYLSKVDLIGGRCYVNYHGFITGIDKFDGWTEVPVSE